MTSPSDAQPPAAPAENGGGANGDGLAGRYYGRSIPYLPIEGYPGKLIAIEGTDGVDRLWLRNLYGFAIAPHMVFYLNVDVKTLIGRVLASRGMDFWESGMDLKHGDDIYDSFRAYQNKLLREYSSMADEFHFRVVD